MAAESNIEWTDHTWNSWEGCQKAGPGCDNCYAETRNARFGGGTAPNWGPGAPRRRTSANNWALPRRWNDSHEKFFASNGRRQRVFALSLGDWLDNQVPVGWLVDMLDVVRTTPNLDWLLLTKRIGIWRSRMEEAREHAFNHRRDELHQWLDAWLSGQPPANVWLGATICNQDEADRDIAKLLQVPALIHFLSMEPLLGAVDLISVEWPDKGGHRVDVLRRGYWNKAGVLACGPSAELGAQRGGFTNHSDMQWGIDWVIVGGESGPGARPLHPEWVLSLRDQCQEASVPFLFKQHGEWLAICLMSEEFMQRLYRSRRKAKLHEDQSIVDELYGRRCTVDSGIVHRDGSLHGITAPMAFLQGTGAMQTFNVGKKAAGRMLNGRTWDGMPA